MVFGRVLSIFDGFQVLRHLFTGIFSLELLLRICGNGLNGFCCSEEARWNFLEPRQAFSAVFALRFEGFWMLLALF